MNPKFLINNLDYMYDYVYIIYAFVKFLDEPPVIICTSCHPEADCEDETGHGRR